MVTKVGMLQVHLPGPGAGTVKTLVLSKLGTWTGCTSMSPCGGESFPVVFREPYNLIKDRARFLTLYSSNSGIGALYNDAALISLWSGEVHIVRNLPTDPVIDLEASIASSRAVIESIKELDQQIVDTQREKQGGELRFTEHFTEDMTLRMTGADTHGTLLGIMFE